MPQLGKPTATPRSSLAPRQRFRDHSTITASMETPAAQPEGAVIDDAELDTAEPLPPGEHADKRRRRKAPVDGVRSTARACLGYPCQPPCAASALAAVPRLASLCRTRRRTRGVATSQPSHPAHSFPPPSLSGAAWERLPAANVRIQPCCGRRLNALDARAVAPTRPPQVPPGAPDAAILQTGSGIPGVDDAAAAALVDAVAGSVLEAMSEDAGQSIARLRGLPWSFGGKEVCEFLAGVSVNLQPEHVTMLHNAAGEAFVTLSTPAQLSEVLQHNHQQIGRRYVEIFASNTAEKQAACERNRATMREDASYRGVLRMRGLPFTASAEDILGFFGNPSTLQASNVHLMRKADGRSSGDAYAVFDTEEVPPCSPSPLTPLTPLGPPARPPAATPASPPYARTPPTRPPSSTRRRPLRLSSSTSRSSARAGSTSSSPTKGSSTR